MGSKLTLCASHAPGMDRDTEGKLGAEFRRGVAQARARVAEFDPEVIVLFGGDHRRAFAQVAPSFAVAYTADLLPEGGHEAEDLNVPTELARELAFSLVAASFDISVCRDVSLDHAFGQPLHHYLAEPAKAQVIPVPVNCASPPLPSAARALEFGRAVGAFFDNLDKRVLFIGTGGLSHSPPSLEDERHDKTEAERRAQIQAGFEAASQAIKPEWDKAFLDALGRWDEAELVRLADRATEDAGVGANEVRTWLAAGAAGGGRPVEAIAYEAVKEWITGMGVAIGTPSAS
ncbi:3-carboxyethylcatechol 2,3-dioxygenase [Agrococcus baldri]|uniref:2,3-dihydroxyphenylpropionate/2, 3-dihydroxicinnamic acid 1,2-dioxygenase n=1 Tax=Agrococcus baldri TaxID=153730 RepID=A0AA87UYT6_9MICO|nr:3-carboxyethylcatechol 2,3-dioxygenase [Agrococcus baldri]GEK81602.1 2,3-dihydroxyphenylpropionate/2,3-dihydroxicinnamic acid 1,2-dioxygenase [Agrococcus baldri]